MSVAPQPAKKAEQDELISAQYVGKVTASRAFRSSSSLPRLLDYYAERAREEPGEAIKEFRVATEALGRGEDFDSRIDSVVRVTTARLRAKLDEYYEKEGRNDPVRLVIPKGGYRLEAVAVDEEKAAAHEPPSKSAGSAGPAVQPWLAVTVVLAAFVGGYMSGHGSSTPRREAAPELTRLWTGIASNEKPIQIVYSNVPHAPGQDAAVLGANADTPAPDDWHTGIGEVEAIHRLTGVTSRLGIPLQLKRAGLADWDEVIQVNVVYLGGPAANPQVAELAANANFVLERNEEDAYVISNRAPREGEQDVYSSTYPLDHDYGLVRLAQGFRDDQWVLVLAGLTTFGTAAAAEMVCEPEQLREVWRSLGAVASDELGAFECVVEVDVRDNVALESRPIACRSLAPTASQLP